METIYHEKQEGQLCAQHCLNNLLQEAHFTAVDLARIADQLDQEEAATLAEGSLGSLASFVSQPSPNMDDSGYFSGQVISRALGVWNLTMALWNAPDMKHVMENPTAQTAFICHHDNHWLTIRKLGRQWFNLNSLLPRPELISDTYLSLFLTQLQMEGYTIFVIVGQLPTCEADQLLTLIPAEPSTSGQQQRKQQTLTQDEQYDADLAAAMSASLKSSEVRGQGLPKKETLDSQYDVDLATAISLSMQDTKDTEPQASSSSTGPSVRPSELATTSQHTDRELTAEELRQKRLKHLGQ